MNNTSTTLYPFFNYIATSVSTIKSSFVWIPDSAAEIYVYPRQVISSRVILGCTLFAVAWILLEIHTRLNRSKKHFVRYSEKEVNKLVDDWIPEPLGKALDKKERDELNSVPIIIGPNGAKPIVRSTGKVVTNLASFNFTGLAGNKDVQRRAIETLRKYGLGTCGPPTFFGTVDVHGHLEEHIANFLGTESAIVYSQGFATVSSVIPAYCKRGDVIVADRGANFAIQNGLVLSHSNIYWFNHNDMESLEGVLIDLEKERKKKGGPLTRRFIVTDGIFENDGAMVDLPKLIELKFKYKYRLILDESFSFGIVGKTGRGLTEWYNVPAENIDMIVGSVVYGLGSSGGFCAGSQGVIHHQRDNGRGYVFSASMPALLAVSASESLRILRADPLIFSTLQENIGAARAILNPMDCITIPSHPESAIIHINIWPPVTRKPPRIAADPYTPMTPGTAYLWPYDGTMWECDVEAEETLLQRVVEEALASGVMIIRPRRLRGQELVEARPSIRLAMTTALTKKETEESVLVVKDALTKVLGRW